MPNRLSISSTAAGLSAQRLFLPPGEHILFVSAPDWNSNKTALIYTSYENVDASFRAHRQWNGTEERLQYTQNDVLLLHGGLWVALYLTNPGTGARLDFNIRQNAY